MRSRLSSLIDQPIILRTLPESPRWEPIKGTVFDVGDDVVDILVGTAMMRTVRLAVIVDVTIDAAEARRTVLEAPPGHADYRAARRALFEAHQALFLEQPAERVRLAAERAARLLRGVRATHPSHSAVEQFLEEAHHLATGRFDYEPRPQVTSGELQSHNYRWAKARARQLEEALLLKRPEDEVAAHVAALGKYAARARANYPHHAELAAWLARAEAIRKKLSAPVQRAHQLLEPLS